MAVRCSQTWHAKWAAAPSRWYHMFLLSTKGISSSISGSFSVKKNSVILCIESSWLQVRPNQKVMHNAYWNINHKPLLVAVNRCNMRVYFCPNMPVMVVENLKWNRPHPWRTPLQESWLVCTVVHKSAHKLVLTKVIIVAKSLHHLPMGRTELLLTFNVPLKMTIHTNCVITVLVLVEGLFSECCNTSS